MLCAKSHKHKLSVLVDLQQPVAGLLLAGVALIMQQ
jgi:hypothetical protein